MNEPENKNSLPVKSEDNGLVKGTRTLQISDKIVARSHQREFELERAHFDTVRIGEQEWMAKNLDVAHFRNGDPIPEIRDNKAWRQAWQNEEPAWCYYDNDPEKGKVFGKLYNWYAVEDERGLVPEGWHLPGYEEWVELEISLWPQSSFEHVKERFIHMVKGKLDNKITQHMKNTGFSYPGGGFRWFDGSFWDDTSYWWQANGEMIAIYDHSETYARDVGHTLNSEGFFCGAVKCIRVDNA